MDDHWNRDTNARAAADKLDNGLSGIESARSLTSWPMYSVRAYYSESMVFEV